MRNAELPDELTSHAVQRSMGHPEWLFWGKFWDARVTILVGQCNTADE